MRTPMETASGERALYVYGVIRASQPLQVGATGLDQRWPVRTVHHQDLAAVVSDVPLGTLEATRSNLLAHERVNAEVLRAHTVIPMSFGTVFRTGDDVVELLRSGHDTFAGVLDQMHDKVEFGVKVLRPRGAAVDAALERRQRQCTAEVLRRLRDVCVASRSNETVGDRMVLNAAFLVQRSRAAVFDQRIQAIAKDFDEFTFQFTGPWPPYNFVAIRLKREKAG